MTTFKAYCASEEEALILESIADVIHQEHRDVFLKAGNHDKVEEIVTDFLDETKNKEGDVFVFRSEGEEYEVTLDRNALKLLRYLKDWLEV